MLLAVPKPKNYVNGSGTLKPKAKYLGFLLIAWSILLHACNDSEVVKGTSEKLKLPKDALWISQDVDLAIALTERPLACGTPPEEAELFSYLRGQILFNSPYLLGGQASKMGLSCNSCHREGRSNPHFFIEGVSDKVGNADVTHGLFGPARDDGIFNPIPIPDLASKESHLKVDRQDREVLIEFLKLQIVEEFDGEAWDDQILNDLATYVAAIGGKSCTQLSTGKLRAFMEKNLADFAYSEALNREDLSESYRHLFNLTARHFLSRIEERLPGIYYTPFRADLRNYARYMQAQKPAGEFEARYTEEFHKFTRVYAGPPTLYEEEGVRAYLMEYSPYEDF